MLRLINTKKWLYQIQYPNVDTEINLCRLATTIWEYLVFFNDLIQNISIVQLTTSWLNRLRHWSYSIDDTSLRYQVQNPTGAGWTVLCINRNLFIYLIFFYFPWQMIRRNNHYNLECVWHIIAKQTWRWMNCYYCHYC